MQHASAAKWEKHPFGSATCCNQPAKVRIGVQFIQETVCLEGSLKLNSGRLLLSASLQQAVLKNDIHSTKNGGRDPRKAYVWLTPGEQLTSCPYPPDKLGVVPVWIDLARGVPRKAAAMRLAEPASEPAIVTDVRSSADPYLLDIPVQQ